MFKNFRGLKKKTCQKIKCKQKEKPSKFEGNQNFSKITIFLEKNPKNKENIQKVFLSSVISFDFSPAKTRFQKNKYSTSKAQKPLPLPFMALGGPYHTLSYIGT